MAKSSISHNGKRLCAGGVLMHKVWIKYKCSIVVQMLSLLRQPHLHKTDVMRCFSSVKLVHNLKQI